MSPLDDADPMNEDPMKTPITNGAIAEGEQHYEPWLFQAMFDEMAVNDLGIGFIYSVLDLLAKRYSLNDVVVNLELEPFGVQMFRLERLVVNADLASRIGTVPGVSCDPPVVSTAECDAVRTACQLALSLHRARFSASHDPLTGLANRRSFDLRLDAAAANAARNDWAFTLVLIDMDGFKSINDTLGYAAGDDLLRQFGLALRQSVRGGDFAARFGGDEFAVILNNSDGYAVTMFTDRLRCNMGAANQMVSFSIGAASSPRESTDPVEIFNLANDRLRDQKGKNR